MNADPKGTPEERAQLTHLIKAVRELEATAARIEQIGGMHRYPEQARAMAEEHKAEARELWNRGVRPLPVRKSAQP